MRTVEFKKGVSVADYLRIMAANAGIDCVEARVAATGEHFRPGLTDPTAGRANDCYNAAYIAVRSTPVFDYVEGWAKPAHDWPPVPHAWAALGNVAVDPVWSGRAFLDLQTAEYVGIRLPRQLLLWGAELVDGQLPFLRLWCNSYARAGV